MFVEGKPNCTKETKEAGLHCKGENGGRKDDADVDVVDDVEDDEVEEKGSVESRDAREEVDVDVEGVEGKGDRAEMELGMRKILRRSKCTQKPSYKLIQSSSLATTVVPQSYQQVINSSDHVHWQNTMLYGYNKIIERT